MNFKFTMSVMLTGLLFASSAFAQSESRVPTESGQAAAAVIEEAPPIEAATPAPAIQEAPIASSVVGSGCSDCSSSAMMAPVDSYGGCSGCTSNYSAPVVSYSNGCSSCSSGYSSFPSYSGCGQYYDTYSSGCCNATGWGGYGGFWNRGYSRPMWFGRRAYGGCGY